MGISLARKVDLSILGQSAIRNPKSAILKGFQCPSAGEDGEAAQEGLLRWGEQFPTPGEGGRQGPMARDQGALAAGQEGEAVPQARGDLLHRQRPYPRGGQLDGERDA